MNDTDHESLPRLGLLLGATTEREADEFEEIAARTLAVLAEPVEPPASLRGTILDLIGASAATAAASGSESTDRPSADPTVGSSAEAAEGPAADRALDAAAPGAGSEEPEHSRAAVAHRHRSGGRPSGLLGRLRRRQRAGADPLRVHAEVLAMPDVHRATTAFLSGQATIDVVSSASARTAVASVSGMPVPAVGKEYQFWFIRKGRARPAGTFVTGTRTGSGPDSAMLLRIDARYRSGDVIAITLEPAGGSRQPTTEPLFALPS